MKKNNKVKKEHIIPADPHASKAYVLTLLILIWLGVALCVLTWTPTFSVLGLFSSQILGIAGGVIVLGVICVLMMGVKCPYCGEKKIGRVMGLRLKKEVECPDCHKKVEIR